MGKTLEQVTKECKAKYEGKYFKYKQTSLLYEPFYIYCFCKEVIDMATVINDYFQTDWHGENKFITNQRCTYMLFQTEISKEEYLKALEEFKNKLPN